MKFDFHTHHERCGHASGIIEDYVKAAIENGLGLIGISDHSPYFGEAEDHFRPSITMAKSEFSHYVQEVLELKEKYKDKIEILLGVESDFFPEHREVYKTKYDQYPFDYVIGSVHFAGGKSIFDKDRWHGLTEAQRIRDKEAYYELIQASARSGMFDILGHIDAMKGYYPAFSEIQTDIIEPTLQVIAECDIAIEINTSGKTKDCGGWYPSHEILERACHYGVKVTFGSDAHIPSRVGEDWDAVRTTLKEIGFQDWVVFRNRQRFAVAL